MKLKLPKLRMPISHLDFMILASLGLIGSGVNEIWGHGPALLSVGVINLGLVMIIARGKSKNKVLA